MHKLILRLILLSSSFAGAPVQSLHAKEQDRALWPFLTRDNVAVAYVDVTQLDFPAAAKWAQEIGLIEQVELADLLQVARTYQGVTSGLTNLGVRQVYFLFRTSDYMNGGPTWIIPLSNVANSQTVQRVLGIGDSDAENRLQFGVVKWLPQYWHIASNGALVGVYSRAQLEYEQRTEPTERKDIEAAWQVLGNGTCGLVVCGDEDSRRVIREIMPPLAYPFDGIDGPLIADHWLWGGVRIQAPPKLDIRVEIETSDAASAQKISQTISNSWLYLSAHEPLAQLYGTAAAQRLLVELQPHVSGTRISIAPAEVTSDPEQIKEQLGPLIQQARVKVQRKQRMNQFKRIALAFHNYHSANKAMPSLANWDSQGQPLLSWRVHLLPYLGQSELYKQFHLDEPWSSDHNRTLIPKMPAVYADPDSSLRRLSNHGKTTFVLPTGSGTAFDGPEPKRFKDIFDGTSNTILFVEVGPKHAVIWTKPEDWRVDFADPSKGVQRIDRDSFTAAFWDGSVSVLPIALEDDDLSGLLTPAGGEIVSR